MNQIQESSSYGAGIGLGIGAALIMRQQMGQGALSSMGIDPYYAHEYKSFNLTFGQQSTLGSYAGKAVNLQNLDVGSRATAGHLMLADADDITKGFIEASVKAPQGKLDKVVSIGVGMGLPILFTGATALARYSEEGGRGLTEFLIEDTLANYYGTQETMRSVGYTLNPYRLGGGATGFISSELGDQILKKAAADNLLTPGRTQPTATINAPLRSLGTNYMIGRLMPLMTSYAGAGVGMQAGKMIGTGLGNLLGIEGYGPGLAGGIFGAAAGAKAGAFLGGGLHRLAFGALMFGGAMMATDAVSGVLKSGFKNPKTRGLDIAGDTAAFFNSQASTMRQRAVQAMHKSHLNARSALGNEASIMHTNRDYFSNYRRL